MADLPEPEAIEVEVATAEPLAVLFGHACSATAHALHGHLVAFFETVGLTLLLDPFAIGDNLKVAMRRLQIHGLIFHATPQSIESKACAIELQTAYMLRAPTLCLQDHVAIPTKLRDRLFLTLSEPGIALDNAAVVANAMRPRARTHWVLQWLKESGRAISEREGGANWLLRQPPQVLAEFFDSLTKLHQLENEDPTVSSLLAAVLERTGMRRESKKYLGRWWHAVRHPLSRQTISDILVTWDSQPPNESQ